MDEGFLAILPPFTADLMDADLRERLGTLTTPGGPNRSRSSTTCAAAGTTGTACASSSAPAARSAVRRNCSKRFGELSRALDLPIHCHVLETKTQAVTGETKYGMTLPAYLEKVGCMTHRLTMNHAILLTDADMEMMGSVGASTTHNPLANLKLGSGVSPLRKLKRAG